MKQKKIFFVSVITCLAVIAGGVLCWRNFYPSPKEVTQKKLDEIFKEKTDSRENDKEELAALFMNEIKKTQLACALADPEEYQEKFYKDIMRGFQKINYEVSEVSRSDESAEVSISINYFKLQEIVQNGQSAFQNELKEKDSLSTEEMIDKLYEMIANEFQKGTLDNSKTTVTVSLYKKNHRWVMEDEFENKIFDAILQQ